MNKVTLLLGNTSVANVAVKWLFTALGIYYFFNGIEKIIEQNSSDWKFWLGFILIATGSLMVAYALLLFFRPKRMQPRIEIDQTSIVIREDMFVKTKTVEWNRITQIVLKPFAIEFIEDKNNSRSFLLRTEIEIAKKIQDEIRQAAELRSIPVFSK